MTNWRPPGLSRNELVFLHVVSDLIDAGGGVHPSYDEIGRELGCVKSGVASYVALLKRKGWIVHKRQAQRNIAIAFPLPALPEHFLEVTAAGRAAIAAGAPA